LSSYPYPWPIGTCSFNQLPLPIQASFSHFVTNGLVDEALQVQQTATEGPFVNFGGWKVRVMIENTSPTTYIVRLA